MALSQKHPEIPLTVDFYPRLLLFSIPKPLVMCSLWADKWMLIHDSVIDQMTCCLVSCLVIKKHKNASSINLTVSIEMVVSSPKSF